MTCVVFSKTTVSWAFVLWPRCFSQNVLRDQQKDAKDQLRTTLVSPECGGVPLYFWNLVKIWHPLGPVVFHRFFGEFLLSGDKPIYTPACFADKPVYISHMRSSSQVGHKKMVLLRLAKRHLRVCLRHFFASNVNPALSKLLG